MDNIKLDSPAVDYTALLKYYNDHKDDSLNGLYKLERFEGGFEIDIKNYKTYSCNPMRYDPNSKIKQLRWKKDFY